MSGLSGETYSTLMKQHLLSPQVQIGQVATGLLLAHDAAIRGYAAHAEVPDWGIHDLVGHAVRYIGDTVRVGTSTQAHLIKHHTTILVPVPAHLDVHQ